MYFFLINWIVSRNFNTAHYIGCDGERDKTLKIKKIKKKSVFKQLPHVDD